MVQWLAYSRHSVCLLPPNTTFRVRAQVQAQSKESLILEVVVRTCSNTHDIALGATEEGGDGAPKRKQRVKPRQREEVDPSCTQRPDIQTSQQGWAREEGGLAEFG